jgi:hypothetical protein
LGVVELLLGVFESKAELIELLGEAVGALSVSESAGGEVADADLQGFVVGFALCSFVLPGLAAAHEFGDQDAGRGLKNDRRGSLFGVHGIIPGPRGEPSAGSKIKPEKENNPNFRSAWGVPVDFGRGAGWLAATATMTARRRNNRRNQRHAQVA